MFPLPPAPRRKKPSSVQSAAVYVAYSFSSACAVFSAADGHWFGLVSAVALAGVATVVALSPRVALRSASSRASSNSTFPSVVRTSFVVILVWCMVLCGIRIAGLASPEWEGLPAACRVPGCSRIGVQVRQRCDGCQVPAYRASRAAVAGLASRWMANQFQSRVFSEDPSFVYGRQLTPFFGFPDNVGVKIACNGSLAVVEAQAELIGACCVARSPSVRSRPRRGQWGMATLAPTTAGSGAYWRSWTCTPRRWCPRTADSVPPTTPPPTLPPSSPCQCCRVRDVT